MTPYAGNPDNYPDEVEVLGGSDAPNSTNLNTPSEGALDRGAFLFQRLMSLGGQNWSAETVVDNSMTQLQNVAFSEPEWDPATGLWLMPSSDVSSTMGLYLSDGVNGWTAIGSTPFSTTKSPVTVCALKDPNDATTYHEGLAGGAGIQIYTGTSGGFSRTYDQAVASTADIQAGSLLTYAVFFTGGSTTGATNLITSPDKMVTPTATNIGATCGAVPRWIVRVGKVSGSPCMVAMACGGTYATPFCYLSFNGHSFNQNALGGGNVLSTDTIVAFEWGQDSSGDCFLMIVKTVGGAGKVLRSSDGVNWTLVTTLTTLGKVLSLACAGRLWVAVLSATAPAAQPILWSPDTVNWYQSHQTLPQGTTTRPFVRANFVSGSDVRADQIIASNKFAARFNLSLGRSSDAVT